jgi:hypothetical protein
MHCLLADYRLALKRMDGVDLASKGLFTKVRTACDSLKIGHCSGCFRTSSIYGGCVKRVRFGLLLG